MAVVTVEVWPWLSELFGGSRLGRHVFQMELEEGTTLGGLLSRLSEGSDAIRQALYGDGVEPSGYVSTVLNGRLPELMEGHKTVLRDGDRVVLVHGYAGG